MELDELANEITNKRVFYHGIEKFPLTINELSNLDYSRICNIEEKFLDDFFLNWDMQVTIGNRFELLKQCIDFNEFIPNQTYNLIYFDAFSPDTQLEMWSYENIKKIVASLSIGGVFVTYCSRGDLKRNLRALGMEVKRFPGPPGKRHVLRATKL